jgi:hypothetical protein
MVLDHILRIFARYSSKEKPQAPVRTRFPSAPWGTNFNRRFTPDRHRAFRHGKGNKHRFVFFAEITGMDSRFEWF